MDIEKNKNVQWIDIEKPTAKDLAWLKEKFGLHPVIVDELRGPSSRARAELHKNYIYFIYYLPKYDKDDDFPVFAGLVAEKVGAVPETDRGILICGSGFGMDIAADKYKNIRAALPISVGHAYQARHDDDANVLAIATDFTDEKTAEQIVKTFLATPFAKEERYARRIEEIRKSELEK